MKLFTTLLASLALLPLLGHSAQKEHPIHGTLKAKWTSQISPQVNGRVASVCVDVGDRVEKDQVVVQLDPLFFAIDQKKQQINFSLAQSAFQEAETEFIRMKNLWAKEEGTPPSIPKKMFDEAKARYQQKELLLQQAALDLELQTSRLNETSIKAPFAGVITRRLIAPGQSVSSVPATPLLEIMDTSQLYLEFSLPQDLLGTVKQGQQATVQVKNDADLLYGTIDLISPNVEESTRSVKCRIILDNPSGQLQPGLSVFGHLTLEERNNEAL